MSDGTPPVSDVEGLTRVARGLIEGWNSDHSTQVEYGQRGRPADAGRFVVIHGLCAHTHRLAEAALLLIEAGYSLEAMPVVRSAFECAITAVWMAQNPEGGRAFANEHTRQQRNAARSLREAGTPALRDAALTLPGLDEESLPSASDAQARAFEQRVKDLNGGPDLYVYYRLMCEHTHPSARLADEYVVPNEDFTDVAALLTVSRNEEPEVVWLFFLAASLMWAGTAIDYIDPSHRRRSELRTAARALGVQRDLHLTDRARARIAAGERSHRRGNS